MPLSLGLNHWPCNRSIINFDVVQTGTVTKYSKTIYMYIYFFLQNSLASWIFGYCTLHHTENTDIIEIKW